MFVGLLPLFRRLYSLPDPVKPIPEPQPDPEYAARMERAVYLQKRAERILATVTEQKPPTTRPA